jgi:hypothetical protein
LERSSRGDSESSIGSARRRFGVAGALGVRGHDEWMRPRQRPSQRPAPSPPSRARIGAAAPATLATNLRRILLAKNGRVAARLCREHPTRNMTICRSIPANVCLRRALRAQAASNRQTSPVRASWERPANGRKCLIARMFAALRSDRLRFLACFSRANRGETGALVPLFAASVGVISSTRQTKFACIAIKTRHPVMSRLSLPARSLRGRRASLRTVPDGTGCLLHKGLIWRALFVMRPAISGVETIFLPALRERGDDRSRDGGRKHTSDGSTIVWPTIIKR